MNLLTLQTASEGSQFTRFFLAHVVGLIYSSGVFRFYMFLFKCLFCGNIVTFSTLCCLQVCELAAGGARGGGDRSRPGPGWQYHPQTLHQCSEGNSHSASVSFPRLAASFMYTVMYLSSIETSLEVHTPVNHLFNISIRNRSVSRS